MIQLELYGPNTKKRGGWRCRDKKLVDDTNPFRDQRHLQDIYHLYPPRKILQGIYAIPSVQLLASLLH